MNTTNIKKHGGIILLFSILLFLAIACKVADAGATADDTTDGGGTTPPVTHTITIKANGGTMGSLSQIPNIADGATVPAPTTGLPYLADNEIAYWSTDADKYNTVFKFDNSKVTSDITIYPHYRLTATKVKSLILGYWAVDKVLFNLRSDNLLARCSVNNDTIGDYYDLKNSANATQLNTLKTVPIFDFTLTSNQTHNVNGTNYKVVYYADKQLFDISVGDFPNDIYDCLYSKSIVYILNDYTAPDTDALALFTYVDGVNSSYEVVNASIVGAKKVD